MTFKTITTLITSTYSLSGAYVGLSLTSSGVIDPSAAGAMALSLGSGISLINQGHIVGGHGGNGVLYAASASAGGNGVLINHAGAYVKNSGTIAGGDGGAGFHGKEIKGTSGYFETAAGNGADGGWGLSLAAGGSVHNTGLIAGGAGGAGGACPSYYIYPGSPPGYTLSGYGGNGGNGGAGILSTGTGTVTNFGKIEGGYLGQYGYAGSPGTNGASGTIAVAIQMSGGTVINGSYQYSGAIINGNAAINIGAGALIDNFGTIENGYVLNGVAMYLGAGSRLILELGFQIDGQTQAGGGGSTLELAGGRYGASASDTVTWPSNNDLTITNSNSSSDFVGFETLAIDGKVTVSLNGAATIGGGYGVVLGGVLTGGGPLTNNGYIALVGGNEFVPSLTNAGLISGYGTITGSVFQNGGTFVAVAGETLNLHSATFSGISGGMWEAQPGAVLQLPDNLSLAVLASGVFLRGPGSQIESFNTVTTKQATLDFALTSITGTGELEVTAGRDFAQSHTVVDSGAIVLSAGTISGAALTLASGGTLSGYGEIDSALTVLAGGVVDITGGPALLDPASHSIVNSGLIEATGGGSLTIESATVNNANGIMLASNGALKLEGATISGGAVSIAAGGVLYGGPGASASTLAMAGGTITNSGFIRTNSGGVLVLSHAHVAYAGGAVVVAYSYYGGSTLNLLDSGIYDGAVTIKADSTLTATGTADTISLTGGTIANTGTLEAASGGELTLNQVTAANSGGLILAAGHLVLDNCTVNGGGISIAATGKIDAGYVSALAMAGGKITNAGELDTLSGASLTISSAVINNAGGTILAGGNGGLITLNAVTVTGVGVLSTQASGGPGSEILLGNASTVQVQGVVSNAGTIAVQATTALTELKLMAATSLTGGGTVKLSGTDARIVGATTAVTLTNVNNTIVGAGNIGNKALVLSNGAAGVIDATGAMNIATTGAALVNAGLMEAVAGGLLTLATPRIDQSGGGTILAAGGRVDLQSADIVGGTIASTGVGYVRVFSGSCMLDGTTSPVAVTGHLQVVSHTTLTLAGAIANSNQIDLLGGKVAIGVAGATLSGGGSVILSNSAANLIVGATSAATLTNVDDHIRGSGALGGASLIIVNEAAGVISNPQSAVLTIDTGANAIQNLGTIAATALGGGVDVKSAIANTGLLIAESLGTLKLEGAVTGTGSARITTNGRLVVEQAFGENVTFVGGTGVLELDKSSAFTGKVSGLVSAGTDSLDLRDIAFTKGVTKATFSGTTTSGTLTVTSGAHIAHISLTGDYIGATFKVSSDGHGGTTVIDPGALTQAMATLQTGSAATTGGPSPAPPPLPSVMAGHG